MNRKGIVLAGMRIEYAVQPKPLRNSGYGDYLLGLLEAGV